MNIFEHNKVQHRAQAIMQPQVSTDHGIPDSLTREGSVDEVVKQLSQRLPPGSPEFLYLGKNSSF